MQLTPAKQSPLSNREMLKIDYKLQFKKVMQLYLIQNVQLKII